MPRFADCGAGRPMPRSSPDYRDRPVSFPGVYDIRSGSRSGRFGAFDLDPCASVNRPWNIAAHHYTVEDDGLKLPWHDRVFCNLPYDKALINQFIQRCTDHRNAIALTFVRTDTKLFQELIFPRADSILFIKGRVSFYHVTGMQGGPEGAPSCLIAFDRHNTEMLEQIGIEGCLVRL